ncbi:MAG TPA: hypothetical protein VK878_12290 [Candidatus Deferrimicrobiaceae bacterium]|nr:hypothetical protein [Candidatus Deferrimicrobiaceae bacterium]
MKHRLTPLLSLVFVLAFPLQGSAMEILTLDRGSISVGPGLPAPIFEVGGPRISISALGAFFLFGGFGSPPCANGCAPGDSLFVGGIWGGTDLPGHVTLDGVTHLAGSTSPDADILTLALDAAFLAPQFGLSPTAVLSGPFSITGDLLRVFSLGPGGQEVTPYGLYGEGTVDVTLIKRRIAFPDPNVLRDAWLFESAEYQLQPIPEPGTLLLWGTGAAGLGLARWLSGRRGRTEIAP